MRNDDTNRNGGIQRFQSVIHIIMGVVYVAIGVLVIYIKHFGSLELPAGVAYTLGVLMMLYGAFRFWRGLVHLRQQKRIH